MTKARGGRGIKAEVKYQTTSMSLHPDTLALLREYAAHNKVTVSEMVTSMITHYSKFRPLHKKAPGTIT